MFLIIFGILLVVLFVSGLPVAFCFTLLNIMGVLVVWGGEAALRQLVISMYTSITFFALVAIPLFILLGNVLFQSGIAYRAIDIADMWLGRLPGRLGLLSVAAATLMATLTGSQAGTIAVLGSTVAPEMEKRGYKKAMSIGPITGAGGLAMMIPPSGLAVLTATLARISVGGLLIAGIIPGLLMATFYSLYITLRCWLQPSLAPSYKVSMMPLFKRITLTMRDLVPMMVIVFLVIGLILLGVCTPSESAALGVLGAFGLAAAYKRLNWEVTKVAVSDTLRVTVMILAILMGSIAFSQVLASSGATPAIVKIVGSLPVPPIVVIMLMQVLLLVMGCFIEEASMLMITLPLFMPIIHMLGFNELWFGALLLINVEMASVTPPFGLNLFVMKGVAPPGTTMPDIYRAVSPFVGCDLAVMALVMAFPVLPLWLPNLMP